MAELYNIYPTRPTPIYVPHLPCTSLVYQSSTADLRACSEATEEPPCNGFELRQEQALHILGGSENLRDIVDIVCYFPFLDPKTPEQVLAGRPDHELGKLLNSFRFETTFEPAANKARRLVEAIRLSKSGHERRQIGIPQAIMRDGDVKTFLTESNMEIHCLIHNTPFADLIGYSVGLYTPSVCQLIETFSSIQACIIQHLVYNEHVRAEFASLELNNQNKGLLSIQLLSGHEISGPINPADFLSDFLAPFWNLFLSYDMSFKDFLRNLRILKMKHNMDIFDTPDLCWRTTIDSRLYLYSRDLANTLTREDAILFSNLVEVDFDLRNQSVRRSQLDRRWNNLVYDVYCAVTADEALRVNIVAATQLLLSQTYPNFFSGLAIIMGLQRAGDSSAQLSILAYSRNNYSEYRSDWKLRPGLPFLAPHYQVFSARQFDRQVREDFSEQLRSVIDCINGTFNNGLQHPAHREHDVVRSPSLSKAQSQTSHRLQSEAPSTFGCHEQVSWMLVDDDDGSSNYCLSLISLLRGAFWFRT